MKKYVWIVVIVVASVVLFANCHTRKKSMASTSNSTPAVTFSSNMKSIVEAKCSPCHIPSKGGNKKALDSYEDLKGSIDDAIRRIQLNPTDRGFMPFRNPKLSDSTIAVFVQWRDAGMPQ